MNLNQIEDHKFRLELVRMIMILTQKLTKDIIRESSFQTYQETKLNLIQEFNGLKAKLNYFVDVSLDSILNV